MAIDSSACFRELYGKMTDFVAKLIRRIGRTQINYYGDAETRLALMLVSLCVKQILRDSSLLFMS